MAGHPNAQLVRKGYDALLAGDMEWMRDHLADDVAWHVSGNNQLTGDYQGKDAVLGLFAKYLGMSAGTLQQEIHDVVGNDEHVLALIRTRAQREGRSLDSRNIQVFHVADGRITEGWGFSEDQAAVDEFYS